MFVLTGCAQETYHFATVNGEELHLDVYTPEVEAEKYPVLIWMHGGGFAVGSRDNDPDVRFMKAAQEQGYLAVSVSYRLLRKDKETGFGCDCPSSEKEHVFREAAKDFWKGVQYVYDHAEEWNIDTNSIIVGGSSAGAEGVMNAIYLKDWVYEDHASAEFKSVDAIPIAGVLSLAGAVVDQRYITSDSAIPGLFYHGVKDQLVPYATAPHHYCSPDRLGYIWLDGAYSVHEKLQAFGASSILVSYPDARHEISGVPFDELDELFHWMDQLFIKKANIHATYEKK